MQGPCNGGLQDPERDKQGKKQDHKPGLEESRLALPWEMVLKTRGVKESCSIFSKLKNGTPLCAGRQAKVAGVLTLDVRQ